jgi:branched-chain amino acid transport system substrate-binding protein
LLIAACGGGGSGGATTHYKPRRDVWIYSSLPKAGPASAQATEVANGIALALAQSDRRAGDFRVHYRSLDAGRGVGGFGGGNAEAIAKNARQASSRPGTVYYIGELLDSLASRVSIPILNTAGVAQVSPTSTAIGLTRACCGILHGEPSIYYPRGARTFARLLPNDAVQAAASMLWLHTQRCSKAALAWDRSGDSLAALIGNVAPLYGVTIVSPARLTDSAAVARLFRTLRAGGANCVEIAGSASPATVTLTKEVHAVAPSVGLILGSEGMCTARWTNGPAGGVPPDLDHLLMCTRPTLPLDLYPGGARFARAYEQQFGATPDANALLGYTAMGLGLDTIASLGRNGDSRAAVVNALMHRQHATPLGTISFNRFGDSSIDTYGLYKVGPTGEPVYSTTLRPRFGF